VALAFVAASSECLSVTARLVAKAVEHTLLTASALADIQSDLHQLREYAAQAGLGGYATQAQRQAQPTPHTGLAVPRVSSARTLTAPVLQTVPALVALVGMVGTGPAQPRVDPADPADPADPVDPQPHTRTGSQCALVGCTATPTGLANRETTPSLAWLDALRHCAICEQAHRFPYRQCDNGHLYCQACFDQVQRCPMCRVDTTKVHRNLVADAVSDAATIPLKCKWQGCDTLGHGRGRERHEAVCPRAHVTRTECQAEGVLRDVLVHLATAHGLPWTHADDCGTHSLTVGAAADPVGQAMLPRPDPAGVADDTPVVLARVVPVVDSCAVRLEFESTAWESWCVEVQLVAPGFVATYMSAIAPLRYPLARHPSAPRASPQDAATGGGEGDAGAGAARGGNHPLGPLIDGRVAGDAASVFRVRLVRQARP